ncbi:hypothetical protein U1Q18_025984 [Sarracenia purpurea var. burkii]
MLLLQHCSHALPQVPSTHNPIHNTTVPMFGVQQITVPDVHTRQSITATAPPAHSTTAPTTGITTFAPNTAVIAPGTTAIAPGSAAHTFAPDCVPSSTDFQLSNYHPMQT